MGKAPMPKFEAQPLGLLCLKYPFVMLSKAGNRVKSNMLLPMCAGQLARGLVIAGDT